MTTIRRLALLMAALMATALLTPPEAARPSEPSGGWYVARFEGPIRQVDRNALVEAGGQVLAYRHPDSYVAWMTPAAVRRAGAIGTVAEIDMLAPRDKLDPALTTSPSSLLMASVYAARPQRLIDRLGDDDIDVLRRLPSHERALRNVYVRRKAGAAEALAAAPEVLYVGPASPGLSPLDEVSDQILAGNLSGTTVAPGYRQWLTDRALDGSGVRVSIVDTGVDPHPDFEDRIAADVDYGQAPTGEPIDSGGHGTHVAGIVGGAGTTLGGIADGKGFLYGLGVAPGVELVDQNAIATTGGGLLCNMWWPPSYPWSKLTQDALTNGAAIWNASWWSCEDRNGNYINTSAEFDSLARDADPDADGAQPFTFVFAAGNEGPQSQTVSAPASSKNVISVGATVNARGQGNPNQIADFSSRGPAADKRILPTVVAPGQGIISTRAFAGAVCNDPYFPDTLGLYAQCSGTSMAAPHVAGAAALITQWWRGLSGGTDPSPALTKALLVNTATDLGTANVPNRNEGWGRVNLGALFDAGEQRLIEDQEQVMTDPDEALSYRVQAADPARPLKITLSWTDAPGLAGANPALVNNLDLALVAEDGTVYYGNRFSRGYSVPGSLPDRINNLENVFIAAPAGVYTVVITAPNLPGDGVPFTGDETDQDFALVMSNAVIAPEPEPTPTPTPTPSPTP